MYKITKKLQPDLKRQLKIFASDPNAKFEHMPSSLKNELKEALLHEQGFVCAYCMCRIDKHNMKVEHFASQSEHEQLQLEYSNMLGCCQGQEGCSFKEQTCDTRKGNQVLKFSPAQSNPPIQNLIGYDYGNGAIKSDDNDFDLQLNQVLNLNADSGKSRLRSNRKKIIEQVRKQLGARQGKRTKGCLRQLHDNIAQTNNGQAKEYFGVALHYLDHKIGGQSASR